MDLDKLAGQKVYVKELAQDVTIQSAKYNKDTGEIVIKTVRYPWESESIGLKDVQLSFDRATNSLTIKFPTETVKTQVQQPYVYPWEKEEDKNTIWWSSLFK